MTPYGEITITAGEKHDSAKPLKGFKGAGVLEVVEDHDGDTYRAVYAVKFKGRIYVLHAFQKKSKRGAETPRPDIDLIRRRLQAAADDYATRRREGRHGGPGGRQERQ